jgi:ADP-dependent glucokinase
MNSFILHNDQTNPTLGSLDLFAKQVSLFSPTLLVVGGLQMLDNFPFKPGNSIDIKK